MSERFRQQLGVVVLHVVVIGGALLTMLPIAWMIYASFKTTTEIFMFPPWLPPATWSLKNYETLLLDWSSAPTGTATASSTPPSSRSSCGFTARSCCRWCGPA